MSYLLHRLAEQELERAFQFYRTHGSGKVALRFLAEFERVAELIEDNTGLGTPTSGNRRRYPFRKFPDAVIYEPLDGGVRVLVVRHDRQTPDYGGERV